MKKKINKKKIVITIALDIVLFFIIILFLGSYIFPLKTNPDNIRFGVTYSVEYSEGLGFNTTETYSQMVTDLEFDLARIPVYWNRIEANQGEFNWTEMDRIMDISAKNNVDVIMAIGRRVPRWPECFIPNWVNKDDSKMLETAQINMMTEVVNRYKDNPALVRWQVENEPYFSLFGECPKLNKDFLKREFKIVRKLDSNTPIQTTASGEQSLWISASKLAKDFVGVSVYRTTYNKYLGYYTYPIRPWMYRAKSGLVGDAKLVVSELQAEPWFARPISEYTPQEQLDIFNVEKFNEHVDYAKEIGFDEVLLWGVEWWYSMKQMGYPEIYNTAKELF